MSQGALEPAVRLWTVPLDRRGAPSPAPFLCPAERRRAAGFRFARDRQRFETLRAALRLVLGSALGLEPGAVRLGYGPHGKPHLADAGAPFFNVSRSAGLGLIALSAEAPVGVDVELVRPLPEVESLSRFLAPAEVSVVATTPPPARSRRFLETWARKEAVVKGLGTGLATPLDAFEVAAGADGRGSVRWLDGGPGGAGRWVTRDVAVGSSHVAALALPA